MVCTGLLYKYCVRSGAGEKPEEKNWKSYNNNNNSITRCNKNNKNELIHFKCRLSWRRCSLNVHFVHTHTNQTHRQLIKFIISIVLLSSHCFLLEAACCLSNFISLVGENGWDLFVAWGSYDLFIKDFWLSGGFISGNRMLVQGSFFLLVVCSKNSCCTVILLEALTVMLMFSQSVEWCCSSAMQPFRVGLQQEALRPSYGLNQLQFFYWHEKL